nr:hypothetical protein [Tanacetum cinerariifolium]
MTLKDFFHFLWNRSTSFFARPVDVPMSVGSPASVANNAVGVEVVPPSTGQRWRGVVARPVGSPRRVIAPSLDVDSKVLDEGPSSSKSVPDIAPSDEACKTLFGSLACTEDARDSDPFLPGIEEARSSRDALCNLSYPDVQLRLDGMTLTELTNFHNVAAVRFLSSDHLSFALADLQEKAMLVGMSQALREVASPAVRFVMSNNLLTREAQALSAESYRILLPGQVPYVDFLVHYVGQSIVKLMTLKPPIILFEKASPYGPSASLFL